MALTQASEGGLKISNAGTNGQYLQKQSGNTGGLTWADVPAGVGGATGVDFNDNVKVRLGTGNDLEIYHDSSQSYIHDNGTGGINLKGSFVKGLNGSNEVLFNAIADGAVELYHNNVKTFETIADGVLVQGTEAGDGHIYLYADEGDDNADKWLIRAGTDGNFAIRNYSTGSWVDNLITDGSGRVGIGVTPDSNSTLHVHAGSAGSVAAGTNSTICLENSGTTVLQFLSPNTAAQQIRFGDVNDTGRGFIEYNHSNNEMKFSGLGGNIVLNSSGNTTFPGTVSDSKGNLRSIPQNAQTGSGGNYVCVASDAGKHILRSGGGVNFPSNVFAAGDAITIINNSASDMNMVPGAGVTLYNTADGQTGQRVLAARGMATVIYTTAGANVDAYISGAGLS